MQPFVCTKFLDQYLVVNRLTARGAKISEPTFAVIQRCVEQEDRLPDSLGSMLQQLGASTHWLDKPTRDILLVRQPSNSFRFGRASYEITSGCNYKCSHCYLGSGGPHQQSVALGDKLRVISCIAQSGCLWLQITGGEPWLDKHFPVVYQYACEQGLLVTISTNGSLFASSLAKLFRRFPPYRIAVSMYGATADSYEALSNASGSFSRFASSVVTMSSEGLRMRMNIILTRDNQHELEDMILWAKELGCDWRVFNHLSPKLDGTPTAALTADMLGECSIAGQCEISGVNCQAGRTFFHVDSTGRAYICKVARQRSIDLLAKGIAGLKQLASLADEFLSPEPECVICPALGHCATCAPILRTYKVGGMVPSRVCLYSLEEVNKS